MTVHHIDLRQRSLNGREAGKEVSRYSLDQYANDVWMSFQGQRYLLNGSSSGWTKTEDIEASFTSYITSLYKSNGIVFAIILARMLLFTEGRFCWFDVGDNGEDGRPAGRKGLEVLEKPWPNCGTGELLARMEQDVSLGGNFYAVREADRLRRLRPDWVTIILTAPPAESTYSDVAGYWYHPGRSFSNAGEPGRGDDVYLPDEMVHFSPIPDPDAQYRGMSWLTPVVREVMADKASMEHKLNFFSNGATFGAIISAKESLTNQQYKEWKANFEGIQSGVGNAYRTLFLASPVDTSVTTANMQQLDFKVTVGAGEPLALDTRIPTPTGWTTMGEIQPGDQVVGRDGLPARVLDVSPIHHGRQCYRVTFNDRTSVVADAGHLWAAMDRNTAHRDEKVYTTERLRELIAQWQRWGNGGNRVGVPAIEPLKLPARDLLIDPYVLGVWLGDGQTAGAAICGAPDDLAFIAAEIESRGYTVTNWSVRPDKVPVIGLPGGVEMALRALGVLGHKHIPDDYLRSSVDQRLDLLRGMMDTDGSVGSRGKETCEYSSKFEHLARQFADLVRSLGYRATVSRKNEPRSRTGATWRVTFRANPEMNPFLLPRKVARCVTPVHVKNRAIVSIEPVESVPVRCIATDAPDHLFAVGDGWVLTHNTRLCAAGGVPPIIVGLSEGLASATYSNYGMARRKFGDHWAHPQWKMASTALSTVVDPPKDDLRLGVNTKGIAFLREDALQAAEILQIRASTISTLITAGYKPDSAAVYAETGDPADLQHTGLTSVQLLPPGTQDTDGDGRPDAEVEDQSEYEALLDEMRADFADEDDVERGRYNIRNPEGSVGGGRFRKLSDAIVALLKDWDGEGDPLADFTEPQLRKTADQLGIDLPRVAPGRRRTRAQIDADATKAKVAILKKLRGKDRSPLSAVDADGKPVPVPSKEERDREILGDAEYERRQAAKATPRKRTPAKKAAPKPLSAVQYDVLFTLDSSPPGSWGEGMLKRKAWADAERNGLIERDEDGMLRLTDEGRLAYVQRQPIRFDAEGKAAEVTELAFGPPGPERPRAMVSAMQDVKGAQLRTLARELGIKVPPKGSGLADNDDQLREYIAKNLDAYAFDAGHGAGGRPQTTAAPDSVTQARDRQAAIDDGLDDLSALGVSNLAEDNGIAMPSVPLRDEDVPGVIAKLRKAGIKAPEDEPRPEPTPWSPSDDDIKMLRDASERLGVARLAEQTGRMRQHNRRIEDLARMGYLRKERGDNRYTLTDKGREILAEGTASAAGDSVLAARRRQDAIDDARRYADAAAELDELLVNDASDATLLSRLDARARREGLEAELAPVREALAGDAATAREVEVENRIRAAYRALAQPGELVTLADIRERLAEENIRTAEVDPALKRLITQPGVIIIPESNQIDLTPRHRSAALRIGGHDKHHILFADPSDRATPTGDKSRARALMRDLLAAHGITQDGSAGDSARYDPTTMQPIDGSLRQGQAVEVVRPGMVLDRDGEKIRVRKAVVEAGDEAPAPSPSPRDLTGSLDADELLLVDGDGREATLAILRRQGFDGPPEVVDTAGLDAAVRDGATELYRGTSAEFADAFRDGDLHVSEVSAFGEGTYAVPPEDVDLAANYAGPGGLIRMALKPGARTTTRDELDAERRRRSGEWTTAEQLLYMDDGRFAAALGYDALAPGGPDSRRGGGWLILNRTALVVQREPGDATLPGRQRTAAELAALEALGPEATRDALDLKKIDGPDGLKAMLRERGLPVSGRKRELVDRLVGHLHPGDSPTEARPPRGFDAADVAEQITLRSPRATEDEIVAALDGYTVPQLRRIATQLSLRFPRELESRPDGTLTGRFGKELPMTPDERRRYIAQNIVRDRSRWSLRSESPDPDDIERADYDDDPGEPDDEMRARAKACLDNCDEDAEEPDDDDYEMYRAAGADTNLGGERLHYWWTKGPGLKRWAGSPRPWTTLYHALLEHMSPGMAKRAASKWFIEVFHYAAGSDKHRVASGKPPRGDRIGPG